MGTHRRRAIGAVTAVGLAVCLGGGSELAAAPRNTIEPKANINGMLVVQGRPYQATKRLFGDYCPPIRLAHGRKTRSCGNVPSTARLFVGYGWWSLPGKIAGDWSRIRWEMWIDGQAVHLSAFGTGDRTLVGFPPANGHDVVLREWSIILVRPTVGPHSIRYVSHEPGGTTDTRWTFDITRP